MNHRALCRAALFSLVSSCGSPSGAPTDETPPSDPLATWSEQQPVAPPTSDEDPGSDSTPTPDVERCDGYDNDGDGVTDEDIAPASCSSDEGEAGALKCIDARLYCTVCEPGETRVQACGCGVDRHDTCDAHGAWVVGPCDDCPSPQPVPCGFCGHIGADGECVDPGECEPGDSMMVRCDECPEQGGCGAHTCVGRKVQCTQACVWEQVEGCEVRQKQCNRDQTRMDSCGQCGEVALSCDGCFWNFEDTCLEHGECRVGASRRVQCDACGGGYRAGTVSCNSECRWSEPTGCSGCQPGLHTRSHGCACSSEVAVEQYECIIEEVSNSCGVGMGVERNHTWLSHCPPVPCQPGARESSGGQCRHCDAQCTWSGWYACGGGAEPPTQPPSDDTCGCSNGQTRTVSCNDLCGNTTTETCNDCTWSRSSCPPCSH